MIRPSADDIDANVDSAKEWPAAARAKLIERLAEANRERVQEAAGGLTAAEVIARFGTPWPGPSDETIKRWLRERKGIVTVHTLIHDLP